MAEDYLISIVARLRDEASTGIANLKREIADLKANALESDFSQGMGNLADETDRAAQSHKGLEQAHRQSRDEILQTAQTQEEAAQSVAGHTEKIQDLRQQQALMDEGAKRSASQVKQTTEAHVGATEATVAHTVAHSDLASGFRDTTQSSEAASTAIADQIAKGDKLLERMSALDQGARNHSLTNKELAVGYGQVSSGLKSVWREMDVGSVAARKFGAAFEEAGKKSKKSDLASTSFGIEKAKQDLQSLTQEFSRFQRQSAEIEDQNVMRLRSRAYANRFGSIARQLPGESVEAISAFTSMSSARQLASPPKVESLPKDAIADQIAQGDKLLGRMSALDQGARNHSLTNKELAVGYGQVASGLKSVWREMDVGSDAARKFGAAFEEAGKKSKNSDLARTSSGFGQFAQSLAAMTDQVGLKVMSLSAGLRGLRLVGLVGFFQPLITGMASLAAGLFSVASGAAQAGATLGGALISGIGQMVPMASIAIASLMRLKSVFQAVQAAQQMLQEKYFQPNQGLITQLQNTSQLIQSEQNLKNAYYGLQDAQVQVRQSQIQLTQARIDAIRNLQDLVIAEQSAKLQMSQSNLAVVQAQQELQKAQTSGSQQAIQQAQLQLRAAQISQEQAKLGTPRASQNLALAQGYGISGSPGMLAATQSARQARLAVVQQEQAIASAQRQLKITSLTLAQPASYMTQSQATLKYLLGQMSPIEKALFGQLSSIEAELRSPNGPLKKITDAFIEPFVYVGGRLQKVLGDPSFITPITKLAQAMGKSGDAITKTMFGKQGTSFFETMAQDATKSLPIVTSAITGLMKVFENIAKAAAPAFSQLSQDWANLWNGLAAKGSSTAGQSRLTEFFNQGAHWAEDFAHLARSIVGLFMALGHDAAPQGMKSVQSFSEAIQDATKWVKSHGPEVTAFFSQARQGLALIGGILFQIGLSIVQVFNLSALQAFAGIINSLVLPAARNFVNVVGFIVKMFMDLVNVIPGAKNILEGFVTVALGLLAIGRVVTLFTKLREIVIGIGAAWTMFKVAYAAFKFGDMATALTALKGAFAGKVGMNIMMGDSIAANGKIAAGEMGASIRTAGSFAAGEIKAVFASGGLVAGGEINSAEAAGGLVAGGEINSAEAAGGLVAGGEINSAEAAGGLVAGGEINSAEAAGGLVAGGEISSAEAAGGAAGAGGAGLAGGAAGAGGAGLAGLAGGEAAGGAAGAGGAGLAGGVLGAVGIGVLAAYATSKIFHKGSHLNPQQYIDSGGKTGISPWVGPPIQRQIQQQLSPQIAKQFLSLNANVDVTKTSTSALSDMRAEAQKILKLPGIGDAQTRSLRTLIDQLDPATVKAKKLSDAWSAAFSSISGITGDVMKQVKDTLANNLSLISINLGTGTQKGQDALAASFSGAIRSIEVNMAAGVLGTQKGIAGINTLVSQALKELGLSNAPSLITKTVATDVSSMVHGITSGFGGAGGTSIIPSALIPGHATGGWHPAQPGGRIARVAEGGHDEVTLTTDPHHAPRSQALLKQYLQKTRMAKGGLVGTPSIYSSPFGNSMVNWGRTDMGVDVNLPVGSPIGVIGNAQVKGVIPNWYAGQPYVWYQLTDGPDAGRYVYDAEQISGVPGIAATDPRATSSLQSLIGKTLMKGQRLAYYATSGTGIETGWGAAGGRTLQQAAYPGTSDHAGVAGTTFRTFLQGLTHGIVTGAPAFKAITAPKIQGVKGIVGQLGQAALDKITSSANAYLSSKAATTGAAATTGGGGTFTGTLSGALPNQVLQFMSASGFNKMAVAGMLGNALQESTMNPNAPGGGLWQQISNFGSGTGGSLIAQMQKMLPQIQSLKAKMNAALSPGDAATIFMQDFERPAVATENLARRISGANAAYAAGYAGGGLLTKHLRRIGTRYLRKKIMRFAEGGRAPWGGEAIPIVAHDGERIANPAQWGEISRMAGTTTTGLDRHLGYDTGNPRQHFDSGGLVTSQPGAGRTTTPKTGTLGQINSFLGTLTSNLYTMDLGSVSGSLSTISNLFNLISRGFSKIGSLGGKTTIARINEITTLLGNFADPNNADNTLALLAAVFQRFQSNLSNWVAGLSYTGKLLKPGQIAQPQKNDGSVTGNGDTLRLAGPDLTSQNIGHTGTTGVDLLNERSLVAQNTYLAGEEKAVQKAIGGVQSSIAKVKSLQKSKKISSRTASKALKSLESNYTLLVQQQETLASSIDSTVAARFQAEQQYVQDTLSQVSDVYQTQQAALQSSQSIAQTKGRYQDLPSIDQALSDSAKSQIDALKPALAQANKIGDSGLVAQIIQQISQFQTTVAQAATQKIQDEISGVQQTFQTQQATLQSSQFIAQTKGRYQDLPSIDQALSDSAKSQIDALKPILDEATNSGNTGLVAQITQLISQFQTTVAQAAAQIIQDAISGVQQTAQTNQARISLLQTIAQTMTSAASTPGQFASAGSKSLEALNLNKLSLQDQVQKYNVLRYMAQSQGNAGAVATLSQTIYSLTAQLAQNELSIQDNTATIVQQTSQFIQSRGQFQTGVYGGLGQIIQTIGQTTGFTDVPTLKALTAASTSTLQGTQGGLLSQLGQLGGGARGLASMLGGASTPVSFVAALRGVDIPSLESGHDQTWINTFEGLLQNLESNTQAIAQNNQQLATLNGQLLQPQQWSTTAWTAFRTAIFSGMGNLLPQLQNVLPPGSVPTIAPIFGSPGSGTGSPTIGNLNINHAPTTHLDPQIIGQQLAHAVAGAL